MTSQAEAAAKILWDAWNSGDLIDDLPDGAAPKARAEGYAAQSAYARRTASVPAGWKIAATSAAGQHHINVDGPIAGRLLADRIYPPGSAISLRNNRMLVCEPEFGFRFGQTLPAGEIYRDEDVMQAVSDMHLTIEVPDSRYTDFTAVGAAKLIADNACARELIVGGAVSADWRSVDLSQHPVHADVAGRYARDGSGEAVLGDPRSALTWLVNEITGVGLDIQAEELVTTGTCMVPLEVQPGDRVDVDYGPFGTISARFEH